MKKFARRAFCSLLSLILIVSVLQISTLTVKAEGEVENIFSDIKGNEWFVPYVQFVYDTGIMSGKGNAFDPAGNMQREEIAQIIYNLAGKPQLHANPVNPFTDVKSSDWFYKSIIWCSANGIVGGIGNGKFGTGQKITREDFALMFFKFAQARNLDSVNNIDNTAIEGYADTAKISPYAKTAMNWAISNGLISGKGAAGAPKSELKLDPKGYTTRAEGATIIKRFFAINIQKWDTIRFGRYEQDNNIDNGKEAIEWEVLRVEGDKALLVSKYVLECKRINESYSDVTWETCSLRKWLNEDFINTAFTGAEQKRIPTVTLVNDNNPKKGTSGGNKTKDKLFLLSIDDIMECYGYQSFDLDNIYGFNQRLICAPTPYAKNAGIEEYVITEKDYNDYKQYGYTEDIIGMIGCSWWTRTPGENSRTNLFINPLGYTGEWYSVHDAGPGIRPVLYFEFK